MTATAATLETGLSPMRIITGKWLSLEVQSLLCLVSLLPFFLLRYFFGHVELLHVALSIASANIAPRPKSPYERGALPRPLLQRTPPSFR